MQMVINNNVLFTTVMKAVIKKLEIASWNK